MERGRNSLLSPIRATGVALGLLVMVGGSPLSPSAMAQGGETQVAKTAQGNPAAAPAPVPAPQPAVPQPAVPQPQAEAAAGQQAGQPANPAGSASNWQANVAVQAPADPALQQSDYQTVEKINAYFNGMTNLQGTFIQTDPDNKQKRGKFYFQRPGKVRFDYGAPSRLKIISNGEYLAIEDHDLNTSDRYPLDMTPFRLLLSPAVDLAKDANILGIEQGTDVVIVTVEDKKSSSGGRIRLFFNKTDTSLKEWIVTDAQGLDTRIEVGNLEANKQVSESLFEFSKDIGFGKLNE